jgi:hypothetical protein
VKKHNTIDYYRIAQQFEKELMKKLSNKLNSSITDFSEEFSHEKYIYYIKTEARTRYGALLIYANE